MAFFYPPFDMQCQSIPMPNVDAQLKLALPRAMQQVDNESVIRQPTMTKALILCADVAGFVNDKDLCRSIDIDPAVWARIKSGQAHFPHDKLCDFFDEAGNEAPLMWLLHRRGYDLHSLHKRESETERKLREVTEDRDKEHEMRIYAESLLKGRG